MDNVDVEHVMTCVPVVYHRVFDFLSTMDLHRVKTVCKTWKDCAEEKVALREMCYKAQLLTIVDETNDCTSHAFNRRNGISSWNRSSVHYYGIHLMRECWSSVPRFGICTSFSDRGRRSICTDTENLVRYWLPTDSKLLVLPSLVQFVCVDRMYDSYEISEVENVHNFVSLPTNNDRYRVEILQTPKRSNMEDVKKFTERIMSEVDDVDTKLLFACLYQTSKTLKSFQTEILPAAHTKRLPVIGCLFDQSIIYNMNQTSAKRGDPSSMSDSVVLSFKGENIRTATLLIDDEVISSSVLKQKMRKLKDTVTDYCKVCPLKCVKRSRNGYCDSCSSQTIAFMIACVARAHGDKWYYDEHGFNDSGLPRNFECATFRKMIHNVPILGAFGMGEIGWSMNLVGEDPNPPRHGTYDFIRGECTVIAVVRFQ